MPYSFARFLSTHSQQYVEPWNFTKDVLYESSSDRKGKGALKKWVGRSQGQNRTRYLGKNANEILRFSCA